MRTQRKAKKSDSSSKEQLVLEQIIGLTAKNANGLASNTATGDCVYIAGCAVVVYNVESGNQSHLMVSSRMPKPLSCVAVSKWQGGFVAAGESGHQPAVLVWDYSSHALLSELKVHQYGVACIAFSPDGKHLVSVGYPHDGYLCLWDWQNGRLVTKFKSTSSCSAISSVSFSPDAHFFVTAGKKHLKFWTVGPSTRSLDGKSAHLGSQKGSSFVSVTPSVSNLVGSHQNTEFTSVYALTDAGVLCTLNSRFSIKKWVDLKVERGFSLSVSKKHIACACSYGVVQLFTVATLDYAGSLQYSASKEYCEPTDLTCDVTECFQSNLPLPDAIACRFSTSEKLVVVYGNHSLYVWDIRDINKVSRCCVLVSHNACIWDVKNLSCENMHDPALACAARGCCGGISFATCSMDGTIRLWDLGLQPNLVKRRESSDINQQFDGNSLDDEHVGSIRLVSAGIFERDIVEPGVCTKGFRSMAVSSDGKYLASGDCQGSLHIYNLETMDYMCIQDSHEADILSLAFSSAMKKDGSTKQEVPENKYLLASGGRDRMINLYDVERGFELVKSLDDHSAAVTSVKLTRDGSKILSCSADRSLVFRDVAITDTGCAISRRHHQIASNGTVYDMAIDTGGDVVVTVGQDKKINTFDISSGKIVRTFKQDGDFGEPIKVSMDPSSTYLVCSYSNKSICVYDISSGELITQAVGHAEVITGIIFLPDCQHIISVGGDGCIFVWKMLSLLSARILEKLKEFDNLPMSLPKPILSTECLFGYPFNSQNASRLGDTGQDSTSLHAQEVSEFRFSISRLPNWAQAKVASTDVLRVHKESTLSQLEEDLKFPTPSLTDKVENCTGNGHIETHTPSKLHFGGGELCVMNMPKSSVGSNANTDSLVCQEISSFATDNRWLTVHTVCLDLLDSPEMRELKDFKMLDYTTNLCKRTICTDNQDDKRCSILEEHDQYCISEKSCQNDDRPSFDCSNATIPLEAVTRQFNPETTKIFEQYKDYKESFACENEDQLGVDGPNATAHFEAIIGQFDPETSKTLEQTKDYDESNKVHQEDDLFIQHFSSLSTKVKFEGRGSSTRSYSAHFTVHRNHLTGCRRLFEASNHTSGGDPVNLSEEDLCVSLVSPSMTDENKFSDASSQNEEGLTPSLQSPASGGKLKNMPTLKESLTRGGSTLQESNLITGSMNGQLMGVEEIKQIDLICNSETEVQKTIAGCKEALLNLDAAAKKSLQLFSNLSRLVSDKEESELYKQAADVLPLIMDKLNGLQGLVQFRSRTSSSGTNTQDSNFEPMLTKFAESLSSKVLELVKKNI